MSETSLSGSRKSIAEEKNEDVGETVNVQEGEENGIKSKKSSPKSSQVNINEGENKPTEETNEASETKDAHDANNIEPELSRVIII